MVESLLALTKNIPWSDEAVSWAHQPKLEQGPETPFTELQRVLSWDGTTDASELRFPVWDEAQFRAGRLRLPWAIQFWKIALHGHERREFILDNLGGIRPSRYFQQFIGSFMGQRYNCDSPPPREFQNHWPCDTVSTGQSPEEWAWEKIQADVKSGAIRRVTERPRVVLPLSVEPDKPRLITDARYINLWTSLGEFKLDTVGQVPDSFREDTLLCNYDHKSGYHHFDFVADEQDYFGFSIRGEYFVFASGCFGYSRMPEVYHITHMALLRFAQNIFKIPCLGYLDDGITGSLFDKRTDKLWLQGSARYAVVLLGWLNFMAGYSISIKKSELVPKSVITWLGIEINAEQNKFFIPKIKKQALLSLITDVLRERRMSITQLESIAGKCMSLRLAVGEAAHVYTRAMFDALVQFNRGWLWGHKFVGKSFRFDITGMHQLVRSLEVWRAFVYLFEGAPWMRIAHTEIRIQTDASGRRWGGVLKNCDGVTVLEVGQEFNLSELPLDIETKEAMGVIRTLEGIAEVKGWSYLSGTRINCWIDNQPLVFCMQKGSSKNENTHAQLEYLFWLKMRYHFATNAIWWSTKDNWESDRITRVDRADDWHLQSWVFRDLCGRWGSVAMDLMASTVNVQSDSAGKRLPFFSRFHCPGSAGIDLFAQRVPKGQHFLFPHPRMVRAALQYLRMTNHGRLILVVQEKDVGWMPQMRGRVIDHINLPTRSVFTLDGRVVSCRFVAFLLRFE